jgi:hypothetical protein
VSISADDKRVSCRCGHGTGMHTCRRRQSGRGCEWCGCGSDKDRIKKLEELVDELMVVYYCQDTSRIAALCGELGL